jgi:hypothetical protein
MYLGIYLFVYACAYVFVYAYVSVYVYVTVRERVQYVCVVCKNVQIHI